MSESSARPHKQAVVLVHGMGEQVPMETLRGFVETMWVRDQDIVAHEAEDPQTVGNPVWWKPDPRTGSFELSRITTRASRCEDGKSEGLRNDFYELYWADLTEANTIAQLRDWFMSLLWRWPWQVPSTVMSVWIILWGLTLIFGGLVLWGTTVKIFGLSLPYWAGTALAISAAIYAAAHTTVLNTFGDVARYVRAKPPNIAARQAIRERGLNLLRRISDSGQYTRIVLVGHSLGTIIAYDLIKLLWAERGDARTMLRGDALFAACKSCSLAGAAIKGDDARAIEDFRTAQQDVFTAMQGRGGPTGAWLISDFITLGSPLTHAQFLLARDAKGLAIGRAERRFPICPPLAEGLDGFLYQPERLSNSEIWSAHHAAPYAAVRWTNIYDPHNVILQGDIISGPLQPNFGLGIKDIQVRIKRGGVFSRFFTHTLYWTDTGSRSVQLDLLRDALDLTQPAISNSHCQSEQAPKNDA